LEQRRCDQEANTNANAISNAYTDSNTNAISNAYTDSNTNAISNACTDSNTYAVSNTNSNKQRSVCRLWKRCREI
jgi:hypothetical protein